MRSIQYTPYHICGLRRKTPDSNEHATEHMHNIQTYTYSAWSGWGWYRSSYVDDRIGLLVRAQNHASHSTAIQLPMVPSRYKWMLIFFKYLRDLHRDKCLCFPFCGISSEYPPIPCMIRPASRTPTDSPSATVVESTTDGHTLYTCRFIPTTKDGLQRQLSQVRGNVSTRRGTIAPTARRSGGSRGVVSYARQQRQCQKGALDRLIY